MKQPNEPQNDPAAWLFEQAKGKDFRKTNSDINVTDEELIDYCLGRASSNKARIKQAIIKSKEVTARWRSIRNMLSKTEAIASLSPPNFIQRIGITFANRPTLTWGSTGAAVSFATVMFFSVVSVSHLTIYESTELGFESLGRLNAENITAVDSDLYTPKSIFVNYPDTNAAAGIRSGFAEALVVNEDWQFWLDDLPQQMECDAQSCNKAEQTSYVLGRWLAMTYLTCKANQLDAEFVEQQVEIYNQQAQKYIELLNAGTNADTLCQDVKHAILTATSGSTSLREDTGIY